MLRGVSLTSRATGFVQKIARLGGAVLSERRCGDSFYSKPLLELRSFYEMAIYLFLILQRRCVKCLVEG